MRSCRYGGIELSERTAFLSVALACVLPHALLASVAVGENVLFNPDLVKDQSELPQGWVVPSGAPAPYVVDDRSSGGGTAFVFRGNDVAGGTNVRQMDIGLVPGARYRLSFKARTTGCSGTAFCVVADAGWKGDVGVKRFPRDSGLTDYAVEFTCMPRVRCPDGRDRYQFILSVGRNFAGEIAFSHLKLEALDEAGLRGTEKMRIPEPVTRNRIIPLAPLLHSIDSGDAKVTVAFRNFDAKAKRLSVSLTVGGTTEMHPFAEEQVFRLARAPGRGTFDVAVTEAENGNVVAHRSFSYAKISRPALVGPAPIRLNNFVSELPLVESADGGGRRFKFSLAKSGWVYVREGARESVRWLAAGTHSLAASPGGSDRPLVRSIGDIYYYSPLTNSRIDKMPKRTWERFVRDVLPNVTTVDGATNLSDEQAAYVQSVGRQVKTFFVSREFKTAEEFDRALRTDRAMTQRRYDGAVMDEQFFDRQQHLDLCTEALWKFNLERPDEAHIISAAIVGNPVNGALDTDFLSAVANASQGRGVIEVEAYYRTKATEREAQEEILRGYGRTVSEIRKANPAAVGNVLLMLGCFVQQPVLSLVHHPEVDYRYYLDMQMKAAATDPVFAGLYGVGVWGSGYADEELHDWTMRLFRHYFIEGRAELLSEKYGLKYLPGIVRNGDFRDGLSSWATAGGVKADRIVRLGRNVLKRWWAPGGLGDEFAVFVRGAKPGRMRQVLRGLEPGRRYLMEFVSFDPREVRSGKSGRRRHPIHVELGAGAAILRDKCWTWVESSQNGSGSRANCGFVNLHHLEFIAHDAEVEVAFDDGEAAKGEEIGINSVVVKLALAGDA